MLLLAEFAIVMAARACIGKWQWHLLLIYSGCLLTCSSAC